MNRRGTDGYRLEDIEYMSEVDAALRRRGHPFAFMLSARVALLFGVLVIWAHFAVLDEVTRGLGQVIPSQRVQEIQNLEGGILQEIAVSEGQIVEKGDILVRIDNEAAASFYRDAYSKSLEHKAAIARLEAELEGWREIVFPEDVMQSAPLVIQGQASIAAAKRQQQQVELRVLENQREQKIKEVQEMVQRRQNLESSLRVAMEQRDIARPLMEKKVYPRVDYLTLEQKVISLRGEIDSLALNIPRARFAAEEARERIRQREAEYRSEALEEMNRRQVELRSLQETLSAGGDRVTRTDVRSPVRGTVKKININTIGGVVKPGESIMQIVPLDDTLLIEARIRPQDIAFLHPGQKATVKITAYDFSVYGGLEGKVEQISADTIQDNDGNSFYLVKLRTRASAIQYRGEQLPIIPGMMATVDILTGKKTVLDYLLKPILKARQNALRER
jgi:adhesin transport system membrane fusion protein